MSELAELLQGLVAQYRALREGKAPDRIYASADVFASLQQQKTVKKNGAGYTFDGVAIEPKPSQSLPFVLRP